MPCPFAQPGFTDMENGEYNDGSILDGLPITTTTATKDADKHHEVVEEPLNYTTYLRTDRLLSALKCLSHTDPSDDTSSHIHDEHFFILIHQVFELWFKQILFEIDSIRCIFAKRDNITPFLFNINLRLNRTVTIWDMLIDQLQLLESMTPMEFLEFRNYITPASGFQSLQFRIIEMKLGLTDQFRGSFKTKYFTGTMFKGEKANELKTIVNEDSLLVQIERWLETMYDSTSFRFLDVFTSAVERFIEHKRMEEIMNGVDTDIAEECVKSAKRQFETMIDLNEYNGLLAVSERRISHKAMLAALMISLYHQEPCFQQSYQMLSLLMDVDALMASWRHKHVLIVQRQIGRKPGTGGTGGLSYLQETVSNKYQVFIDLSNVSSYLIPQRFLPKLMGMSNSSIPSISSLTLQPHQKVPVVCRRNVSMPKHQSVQDPMQYYQILLFLFLFVAGCIFATVIGRFACY